MEFTNIYQNMNKQEIYQEIEKILNEINNISQSLSSSREFISENSNKRAQARLAEIESNLQIIAGRIAEINSVLRGKSCNFSNSNADFVTWFKNH